MKPESMTERYRFSERPTINEVVLVLDGLDGDLPVRELRIRPEYSAYSMAFGGGGPMRSDTPDSYVLEITLEGEK